MSQEARRYAGEAQVKTDNTNGGVKGRRRLVAIVGAGPVGCLSALVFAKAGWRVTLYEGRPDMRQPSSKAALAQRSVNLAISSRGLAALSSVDRGLTETTLEMAVPMKGRMLHTDDGKIESQLYDPNGQCINSIDRRIFNEILLEAACGFPEIQVFFQYKLLTADFDARLLTFFSEEKGREVNEPFDFCVGADGSYSNVRRQMMRVMRMNYQQEYVSHEYLELKIPAGRDDAGGPAFVLDPNHLHIWPRHSFMLIALPNKDKTFTCTLFAPTSELKQLTSRAVASTWFKSHFPDVVELIGEDVLLSDLVQNPRSSLMSLKATPYHYRDRCLILGDAAHSMVPFYGQGLNCGLEDVRVLVSMLRSEGVQPVGYGEDVDPSLARALARYSEMRHEDLVAISDMAMDNYIEMRHAVTTPGYILHRTMDLLFSRLSASHKTLGELAGGLEREPTGFHSPAPRGWLPLYTMVTFRPDISYAAAKKKAALQSRIIAGVGWTSVALGGWMCLARIRKVLNGRRT